MPILHMQTEAVRAAGQQINQTSESLRQQAQQLRGRTQQLANEWQGPSASMFEQEMQMLLQQAQQSAEAGGALNQKVQKEVDEWEQVAADLGLGGSGQLGWGMGSIGAISFGAMAGVNGALGTAGEASSEQGDSIPVNVGEPFEKLADGPIPLYKLNLDNLDNFDPATAAQALDTGGRPVLFIVHGFDNQNPNDTFQKTQQEIQQRYANYEPESKRPVIVGIEWDSGSWSEVGVSAGISTPIGDISADVSVPTVLNKYDYLNAIKKADNTGEKMGEFLNQIHSNYPDTSINVMTHSLGTYMVMEGVRKSDVQIDNFLAIQGAVNVDYILKENILSNGEINNFGATYNRGGLFDPDTDTNLRFHESWTDGNALGRAADNKGLLDQGAKAYAINGGHSGLHASGIHNGVFSNFFGDTFGKPSSSSSPPLPTPVPTPTPSQP